MHPAPVRLNRRYSTSSFPSLRVGGSFWHNKAIPDLIFILPVVQHPVSYQRRACTPPCRYYWPSDCEQAMPQPAKFLGVPWRRFGTAAAIRIGTSNELTCATYQCTLLLSIPCHSTITWGANPPGKMVHYVPSAISSFIILYLYCVMSYHFVAIAHSSFVMSELYTIGKVTTKFNILSKR